MREIDFRYRLLRNSADMGWLNADLDNAPTVRADSTRENKISLAGNFDPVAVDADGNEIQVDFLRDEIQPLLIIDGEESPLGIFAAATVIPGETESSGNLRLECYDRCWQVQAVKTESILYWAAGTNYMVAIEQLLTAAGIKAVNATPTSAVFATAREDWPVGTSLLVIINSLLREIGYKDLWFNASGIAMLEPAAVPRAANIRHTLDGDDPDTLVWPGIERKTDVFDAANVFIASCSNPDLTSPLVATSVNDNPQSPLSVTRRGKRICRSVKVDNIPSQAALQAYADRLRDESLITGETLRVTTLLQPGWGVDDVASLHYRMLNGDEINAVCIARSWSMELKVGGQMSLDLERVVYNID